MVNLIINKIVLVLTKYHGSAETDSDRVNEKTCLFLLLLFVVVVGVFFLNQQEKQ